MFDKVLTVFENVVMSTAFAAIAVLAFTNVISRYVFHGSLSWSQEIVTALAVYLFMTGTAAALRLGAHPDFSALRDMAKGWLRVAMVVLIGVAIVAFFVVFMWIGLDMLSKQAAGSRSTIALGIPQWILTAALPLGALLGGVRAVQVTLLTLHHKGPKSEAELYVEEGIEARG